MRASSSANRSWDGDGLSSGQKQHPFVRSKTTIPPFSSLPGTQVVFRLGTMPPTMSAHLTVEGLEARGLVGAARSSPQPPLAVARRARLEVVVPTRQHWTKRLMSSVSVLTDCGCLYHCRIHRSLRGPLIASAATSRWKFGAAMSRTQSANAAAEGTTRSPALVPAGTALRRLQRRIGCFACR